MARTAPYKARTRWVALSTGKRVPVVIGMGQRVYYPDQPHCCVCDRAPKAPMTLYQCDRRTRARSGLRAWRCHRLVCPQHVQRDAHGRDLCPTHAPRDLRGDPQ